MPDAAFAESSPRRSVVAFSSQMIFPRKSVFYDISPFNVAWIVDPQGRKFPVGSGIFEIDIVLHVLLHASRAEKSLPYLFANN